MFVAVLPVSKAFVKALPNCPRKGPLSLDRQERFVGATVFLFTLRRLFRSFTSNWAHNLYVR